MNASEAQVIHAPSESKRIAGGLVGETIGSIAVMALAVVGLAGALSATMAAIATIVLGAAILIEGGVFAGKAGMTEEWPNSEFLGGVTGVILGILALLGNVPNVLLSVSVIVFGASLLFSHLTEGDFSSRALVGIGAIVLGILAVVGLSSLTLVLVALLSLGAMSLFGEMAESARLVGSHRIH